MKWLILQIYTVQNEYTEFLGTRIFTTLYLNFATYQFHRNEEGQGRRKIVSFYSLVHDIQVHYKRALL